MKVTLQTYLDEVRRRCEISQKEENYPGLPPTEAKRQLARTDVPRLLKMVEYLMQEVRAEYCYDEVRRVEHELDRLARGEKEG